MTSGGPFNRPGGTGYAGLRGDAQPRDFLNQFVHLLVFFEEQKRVERSGEIILSKKANETLSTAVSIHQCFFP